MPGHLNVRIAGGMAYSHAIAFVDPDVAGALSAGQRSEVTVFEWGAIRSEDALVAVGVVLVPVHGDLSVVGEADVDGVAKDVDADDSAVMEFEASATDDDLQTGD